MTTRVHDISHFQKRAFWIMIFLVLILSCVYGLCVRRAIMATVEREKAEHAIASLNAELTELEQTYLSLSHTEVTLDKAKEIGLLPVSQDKIVYINRNGGPSFTFNARP